MIIIDISPVGYSLWQSEIDGEVIGNSRTPLLSTARILRLRGVPDDTRLGMRRKGQLQVDMVGTVGSCAVTDVVERPYGPRFEAWKPDSDRIDGPPAAAEGWDAA